MVIIVYNIHREDDVLAPYLSIVKVTILTSSTRLAGIREVEVLVENPGIRVDHVHNLTVLKVQGVVHITVIIVVKGAPTMAPIVDRIKREVVGNRGEITGGGRREDLNVIIKLMSVACFDIPVDNRSYDYIIRKSMKRSILTTFFLTRVDIQPNDY